MLTIDGSRGEGGGQVLRAALALSMATRTPFRMERIRARRPKQGLMRQHLVAVEAAAAVCRAETQGAELGSLELTFRPGAITGGDFHFPIGTAGSVTLVLQAIVPALALARESSRLLLEGGTHNPFAPPYEFLSRALVPILGRMGPRVDVVLEKRGFYPTGGGSLRATVEPSAFAPLTLLERGAPRNLRGTATVVGLSSDIAERERRGLLARLGWSVDSIRVESIREGPSWGNYIALEIESEHVTEVVTSLGERGVRAEEVARRAAGEALEYLASSVPVGPHLADQLIVPIALAGRGAFRTVPPTPHTTTQIDIVRLFLGANFRMERESETAWRIELG